ncbi:MAG: rod shape-determining protein RodA [Hyphomicrobium sp.]
MVYAPGYLRRSGFTAKLLAVNWPVAIVVAALAALGAATLYSVAGGSFQPWAERHTLRFLVALAFALAIAVVRVEIWLKAAYPVLAVALALLALVPIVGVDALGARRWIGVGGFSFQPSELMKVALVVALARYYQWLPADQVSRPQWVAIPLAMILLPVALTLAQPDLGSAVLFAALGLSMMFLAGVSFAYFAAGALIAFAALPAIISNLYDYQRRRLQVFLDPTLDPLGAGYHITQSKIALGSGGVSGKGYMQGTQSQLDFVPEKHTDFIAAMIGEEWGFVGLAMLLLLYATLLGLMAAMAWRCGHRFGRLVIAGAAVTVFVYVFINLSMVAGMAPVVGVPLPLISYGGTSMTTVMIAIGLALSSDVHRDEKLRSRDLSPFW